MSECWRKTTQDLKTKFLKYGHILAVIIHSKKDETRYGFVTFSETQQTFKVLESVLSDPDISHYDVFFGGRRAFCRQVYEDLDELVATHEESEYYHPEIVSKNLLSSSGDSFNRLLQEALRVKN